MPGKVIRPRTSPKGYFVITLDGDPARLHRVIATTFIPNPHGKPQVNHKNGVKTDNRVCNLEWVNNSENQKHRYSVLGQTSHLKGKRGIDCVNSKPVKGFRVCDGESYAFGSAAEAGRGLGVSASGISLAARGESNQHAGVYWEYISRDEYLELVNAES